MSEKTDELRDIFLDVSDQPTLTESQEEGPSRDPIGEEETAMQEKVSEVARADGLGDAVDDLGSDPDAITG